MKKIIIYILLALLCMITIFCFSSKNTMESNSTSKNLIRYSVRAYEKVTNKEVDEEKVITKLNYPIRKLAHFSIYFLLGIFVYSIFSCTKVNHKLLLSMFICIIYASLDETHQLFVYGRTAQVLDVLIDSVGSLISMLIIKVIKKVNEYFKNFNSQKIVEFSHNETAFIKTKFYKANHTKKGSGIGLAVADEIIQMHGGTLTLESEEGKGTKVTITIPPQKTEDK